MSDDAQTVRDFATIQDGVLVYYDGSRRPATHFESRLVAEIERLTRENEEYRGLWHCTLDDKAAMDANLLRAEAERDEAKQLLREAINQTLASREHVARLEAALRGLLDDDELCRYPPDGDECICSSCRSIRDARAALASGTGAEGDGSEGGEGA